MTTLTSINHHPDVAWLIDYAVGTLSPGFAVTVGAHLRVCRTCREQARSANRIGAQLIDACTPISLPRLSPATIRARATPSDIASPSAPARGLADDLAEYVANSLGFDWAELNWKHYGGGVDIALVNQSRAEVVTVIRAQANAALPRHGHEGCELTVVLKGAYFGGGKRYGVGDIDDCDSSIVHQPLICGESECVSLIVADDRLRYENL